MWQEGSKAALEILAIFASAAQSALEIQEVLSEIYLCYKFLVNTGHSGILLHSPNS